MKLLINLLLTILLFFLIHLEIYAQINSTWASTPPTIVWKVDWEQANKIKLESGWLLVQNDTNYVYFLVDLTMDTIIDVPLNEDPWGDYFSITFDINNDKLITPNIDLNYGFYPGQYTLGFGYYLDSSSWTGLNTSQAKLAFGYDESFNSSTPHRIWLVTIPLQEIQKKPGQVICIGIETYSQNPSFYYQNPMNFTNDFSNLIGITLVYPNDLTQDKTKN